MAHTTRYAFRGTSRLAVDSGLSKSTISHLVHGKVSPLYITIARVVKCLERALGRTLDCREIASEDGTYPTKHVCALVGCSKCLPDSVYEPDGRRKPDYAHVLPGQWTGDHAEFEEPPLEMTE